MSWPALDGTPRTRAYRRPRFKPVWKPDWWPAWGPSVLPYLLLLAFYLPLAGRWFASEDFLLLRVLRERPPWADVGAWLGGPWLGIDVVRFYRPLATLLLALEDLLFAAQPWAYNLAHLAVHALSVGLVYRVARLLAPPRRDLPGPRPEVRAAPVAALGAAVLFALHPLHPNAVSWIASYATLFAGPFFLGCVVLWLSWRRQGGAGRLGGAVALFVAALGCYEAAAALPLLLAAGELLLPRPDGAEPGSVNSGGVDPGPIHRPVAAPAAPLSRRRRFLALVPFALGLALYLLLRHALFGDAVGGYGSFAARLSPAALGQLLGDAVLCLYRLLHPIYAGPPPSWAPLLVAAWFLLPPVTLSWVAHRRAARHLREEATVASRVPGALPPVGSGLPSAGGFLGVWCFGWAWAVLAFAPFAFQPFVPANGRFAYLAAAGLAVALGRLVAAAVGGGRGAAVPAAVVVALGLSWAVLLAASVADHRRAGVLSRSVTTQLASVLAETPTADGAAPVFVVAPPDFLRSVTGTPLAQVLRYGLSDSQKPPFSVPGAGVPVYPLPATRPADLAPLAAALPRARFYRWVEGEGELRQIRPLAARRYARRQGSAEALGTIAVAAPGERLPAVDGASAERSPSPGAGQVAWRAPPAASSLRLVLASEGNPLVVDLPAAAPGQERVQDLPMDFVRSMTHLYGTPTWWWIEARQGRRLVAASRPRTLP